MLEQRARSLTGHQSKIGNFPFQHKVEAYQERLITKEGVNILPLRITPKRQFLVGDIAEQNHD